MDIQFKFDSLTHELLSTHEDKLVSLNSYEKEALKLIYEMLVSKVDLSAITLKKNSDSYTSIFRGEYNDFVRFKITDRTKWISIRITESDRDLYCNSPLFIAQKNKNQLHWKAKINSVDEIHNFKSLIINSCLSTQCDYF